MVLEKTLESPLDCKEIQQVYLKGDQSWVFIGRTDVEVETHISPAILNPACASSSPVFLMMYFAYKLNKQGDNIQP